MRHLPGKHDQSSHGKGGGSVKAGAAPETPSVEEATFAIKNGKEIGSGADRTVYHREGDYFAFKKATSRAGIASNDREMKNYKETLELGTGHEKVKVPTMVRVNDKIIATQFIEGKSLSKLPTPDYNRLDSSAIRAAKSLTNGDWHDDQVVLDSKGNLWVVDLSGLAAEDRHLPGKHDQSTHGKGGSAKTIGTPVKGSDQSEWAFGVERDLNNPSPLSYSQDLSDPVARPLVGIGKQQGFDGKPQKGSVDDAIAAGGTEIHRGIIPHTKSGTNAEAIEKKMTDGSYEPGKGIYGNGYYFSTSPGIAKMYAAAPVSNVGYNAKPVEGGRVVRAALHKDAKIIDYQDVKKQHKEWYAKHKDNVHWNTYSTDFKIPEGKISPGVMEATQDPGQFAALMGYDAIRVPLKDRPQDRRNKARIKKKIGSDDLGDEIVVLNRTALVVE